MGFLDRLFGKPSIADFAAQMIQAFREAGDKTDLRFDAAENRIVRGESDDQWTVNLGRTYHTYLKEPCSQRAQWVRSLVPGVLTSVDCGARRCTIEWRICPMRIASSPLICTFLMLGASLTVR